MKIYLVFILIVGLFIMGCQSQETGTLKMQITDAPIQGLEKAQVTISQIQVHMAGVDENVETESGWVTIVEGPKTYDLLKLKGVKEILGEKDLEPGKYTQIRLVVESAKITISGTEYELDVPSDKIKLIKPFNIEVSKTTTLTLDFVADESIKESGRGEYKMQPTIKVLEG